LNELNYFLLKYVQFLSSFISLSISPNSEIFESNQSSSSSSSAYSSNEESFQNIIIFPVGSENQEDQQDNENNDDTSSINTDEWQDALEPSDDEGSI
jgi:hypothetical protein